MTLTHDKGTTSINLVHEAIFAATQRNLDVRAALQHAGISEELLSASRARVSTLAFARLWAALADLMGDEFFGLDSHPMRRGSYALMCHAVLHTENLEHALRRMLKFLRAVLDDLHGELRCEGDQALIILHDRGVTRRLFAYGTWYILVHGFACWLARRRIPLHEMRFRATAPNDDSDYRTRFCEDITFSATETLIRFDRRFLNLKVVETESTLRAFLQEAPANILVKYRNESSTTALIRRRLRKQTPDEWPELDTLAQLMNMSSATLQRRLLAEDMSYRRLKDELRRDIAIDLFSNSSLTVAEVAARTGFQETSAFHRAFKKWTGASPGIYRHSKERPASKTSRSVNS
ncbi:AraC family transcriptional regulator [Paraburkholderia phymatum]|uniref:Transcriptional regulator, AraC family n=1 Tax=Paraburkholderia phymatum (strain DSM 17167 / CIP 108236 / LMG 21445 / STM815) TaxID=391038 RepID=B2JSJ4_PARP8|nr:AraC family transcriptional regulator [Paraburkholderia phymatum]ACC74014.1 transcriptional regulator, AraC family [Paraburkholderia phymatum STM815]